MVKLTVPHSPKLTTKYRTRNVPRYYLSQEEKENQIFEEMKKNQFKAQPLNKKILQSKGVQGLKRVEKKAPTKSNTPLVLKRSMENKQRKELAVVKVAKPTVKARPLNKKVLEGIVGLPPKQPIHLIEPQPFRLRTDLRGKKTEEEMKKIVEEETKKEAETASSFRALPMPDFKTPTLKKVATIIDPAPFNLQTDQRGEAYQEKMRALIEEEKKKKEHVTPFRARPANVHKPAFVPAKSQVPLAVPVGFNLRSDERAPQRNAFDRKVKQKQAIAEKIKKEKEESERRTLRSKTVFRAGKIKFDKKQADFVPKESSRSLTEAPGHPFEFDENDEKDVGPVTPANGLLAFVDASPPLPNAANGFDSFAVCVFVLDDENIVEGHGDDEPNDVVEVAEEAGVKDVANGFWSLNEDDDAAVPEFVENGLVMVNEKGALVAIAAGTSVGAHPAPKEVVRVDPTFVDVDAALSFVDEKPTNVSNVPSFFVSDDGLGVSYSSNESTVRFTGFGLKRL
ncbi:putative targeting protein for Xklp2 [Blattamonas nauphoetae]|uniref:Targeting protein for Xklp2 n=1 Tax=Blattamonas nauphoetae TaxID=2049346 RepID=A0ABQ9XXT2_9EUKA|nr:putative targeting protein for Xklp2 [Blattamonas nauphoetae]